MRIGHHLLAPPVVLAPMAGYTDLPFRLLARRKGCALVCSEMVSANGLVRGNTRTGELLTTCGEEKPLSVQLFGADPRVMGEAARIAVSRGADIIDINFGCPARKILRGGAGAALMRDPRRAEAIIGEVRRAVSVPVTVKIRKGWDPSGCEGRIIARIAQECGVDAVIVHPRTVSQGFSGCADWSVIGECKQMLTIPVIGNGDVRCAEDVIRMRESTGCDGVMIGRAALVNPWIFSQARALLEGEAPPPVPLAEKFGLMLWYVDAAVRVQGEGRACRRLRSRLGWFIRGMPGSSEFRRTITHLSTRREAEQRITAYWEQIAASHGEREEGIRKEAALT